MASGKNDKTEIIIDEAGTDSIKDEAGEECLHEFHGMYNQENVRVGVIMTSGKNKPEIVNNEDGTDSIRDDHREESFHDSHVKHNQETISVKVKRASGKNDKPKIRNNEVGKHSIKDYPIDESFHELHVNRNDETIPVKMAYEKNDKPEILNKEDGTSSVKDVHGEECFHDFHVKHNQETIPVKMESGKNNLQIINMQDCTVSIYNYPREESLHELFEKLNQENNTDHREESSNEVNVKHNQETSSGSPVEIQNCDSSYIIQSDCVTADGIGLTKGIAGEPCEFTIYRNSIDADLAVCVKGPSVAEVKCHNNQDDTVSVSYLPAASGVYKVKVKSFGKNIAGSPFKAPVNGSPFRNYDDTIERSIYRAVIGAGLKRGVSGEPASFTIYKKGAGAYGLAVAVQGHSIAEIKCYENNDIISVQYLPTAPGEYTIVLRFHGKDMETMMFTAQITGRLPSGGFIIQKHSINLLAAKMVFVGHKCALTFQLCRRLLMRNRPKDVNAHVQSPSGIVEDYSISNLGNFLYRLMFVPQEIGVYTITVQCLDKYTTDIRGSPFLFTVGPFRTRGADRIHAGGPGLVGGNSNEPCEFYVWTREAGPGNLEIYVEGLSKADIEFKGRKDESWCISYKVPEPGDYRVGITFNYKHIPYSPFNVLILPPYLDVQSIGFNTKRAPS